MVDHVERNPYLSASILENNYINRVPAKFMYLNCHPLEDVSPYSDPQLQVGKNYSYHLFHLSANICKS